MDNAKTLPLRVSHQPDQPPTSFASRLAWRNFMPARFFTRDMGIDFNKLASGCEVTIAKLALLGAASLEALMKCSIRKKGSVITLKGQVLNRNDLRRSRVHICPRCVQEDIAGSDLPPKLAVRNRVAWALNPIRTCPIHDAALIEVAKDIPVHDTHDWTGNVTPVISSLPDLVDNAPTRKPSGLETYLMARLDGHSSDLWLDTLEFHAAAHFVEIIGAVAAFGKKTNLDLLTENQKYRAADIGFAVVKDGPAGIHEFMSQLKREHVTKASGSADGPQAVFGKLYTTLAHGLPGAAYDPIREILSMHIFDNFALGPGDELFGKPVAIRKLHSIRTALVEYKMHPKRLRKLVEAEGLLPNPCLLDRDVLIDAAAAGRIFQREQNSISLKDAEIHLNAGRVQTKCLWDAGLIRSHKVGIGQMNEVFLKDELDGFLARLLTDAMPVDDYSEPIMDLREAARRACCSVVQVVHLILDRQMAWVGRHTPNKGFASMLVKLDEVKARVASPALPGLPATAVAKQVLKTNPAVVTSLIEIGALKTIIVANPVNRCPTKIVPFNEIERFKATYVSLYDLSQQHGLHMTVMNRTLKNRGILPAAELAGVKATFYRRADL